MKKIIIIGLVLMLSGCATNRQIEKVINDIKKISVELSSKRVKKEAKNIRELGIKSGQTKKNEWQKYNNKEANFSLKFPEYVNVGKNEDSDKIQINIDVIEIGKVNIAGFNLEELQNDAKMIENGEYGKDLGWSLENSRKVREITGGNAQENLILSRDDLCDVIFERNLVFYNNNYQIILSLIGPKNQIINNHPEYFKEEKERCQKNKNWAFELQSKFYYELEQKNMTGVTQEWYNLFDDIVKTLRIGNNSTTTKETEKNE